MGSNRQSPMWCRRQPPADYNSNSMKMDVSHHLYQQPTVPRTQSTNGHHHHHNFMDKSLMVDRKLMDNNSYRSFGSMADVLPCSAFLPPFLDFACKMSAGSGTAPTAAAGSTSDGRCRRPTSMTNGSHPWWNYRNGTANRPRRLDRRHYSSPPSVRRYRHAGFSATDAPSLPSPDSGRIPEVVPEAEKSWRSTPVKCSNQIQQGSERRSPRILDDQVSSWRWPTVAATPPTAATYAAILKKANLVVGEEALPASGPAPTVELLQQQKTQPQATQPRQMKAPCMFMTNLIKLVPMGTSGLGGHREGEQPKQSTDDSPKRSSRVKNGQCRLEELRDLLGVTEESAASAASMVAGAGNFLRSRLASFSTSPPVTTSGTSTTSPSPSIGLDDLLGRSPVKTEPTDSPITFACILGMPRRRQDSNGSSSSAVGVGGMVASPPAVVEKSCANTLIAFIMGGGVSSDEDSSEEEWESDWEDDDDLPISPSPGKETAQDCVDGPKAADVIGATLEIPPAAAFIPTEEPVSIHSNDIGCRQLPSNDETLAPSSEGFTDYNEQLHCLQQLSDDALAAVNDRWNFNYSDVTPDRHEATKKVSFFNDGQPYAIHEVDNCCRRGQWEEFARDRQRFQRRVCETATLLDPILRGEHRQRVYGDRFSASSSSQPEDNNEPLF